MASRRQRTLRPPRQARSARTLEALLASAGRLLEREDFASLSVARIAARAGVTIGAFYARFRNKDALLEELERRMTADFTQLTGQVEGLRDLGTGQLEPALLRYHRLLVGVYRRHRGVCRALVLRSHSDRPLRARLDRLNRANLPRVAEVLRSGSRPPAADAVRFGLLAVRSQCRELVVLGEGWPDGGRMSDEMVARELTRMLLRYLDLRPSGKLPE